MFSIPDDSIISEGYFITYINGVKYVFESITEYQHFMEEINVR